jgi:PTH1 family peptidyl-tRNA hydrolase
MKAVIGLGNPGLKYEGTRHNIGFDCLRMLSKRLGITRFQGKYDAEIGDAIVDGEKVILVFPLTYMNLSGNSVKPIVDFFRLPLSDLLVICDDLALEPGKIRLRAKGSSGGQKGLKHICERLGSDEVPRLRIGIGATPAHWETADYVLSKFSSAEATEIELAKHRGVAAVECWLKNGLVVAMNQFNSDPDKSNTKSKDLKATKNPKQKKGTGLPPDGSSKSGSVGHPEGQG